ncbi:MAG TPA: CpaF family protein [Anaerolineales bacterium]|nr:CpaF family protein [Anaerolineales bacterium]
MTLQTAELDKLKVYLTGILLREFQANNLPDGQRRQAVTKRLGEIYAHTQLRLPDKMRDQVFREVLDELLGYGPIQLLLDDPEISEVMVNGPQQVYVERNGRLFMTDITFEDDAHVLRVIERIILPLGRRIDHDSPMVDARMPDGSRVNAIIPPVAIDGPSITIRKFASDRLGLQQLIEIGSITVGMVEFLRACVAAHLNIIISGGTGTGKTTLLNLLSSLIADGERIVTIEDAAELQLRQRHVVRLETKPSDLDGRGQVTTRDLVRNALRMRPDRIIIGEVRGGETLDMLQAMNTGHDGSLTTVHANTPRDTLSRLETMTLMSGVDLPLRVIREQIASAIDLIIQQSRLRDGSRKVSAITEVAGMEGDTVVLTDIFRFEQTGVTEDGRVLGALKPTGIRPLFGARLEAAGFILRPEVFGANIAEILASNRRRR